MKTERQCWIQRNWGESGINRKLPHISEEGDNEEKESAISLGKNENGEKLGLVQGNFPETSIDMVTDNQNEVLEGPEIEESDISNLWGNVGKSPGKVMRFQM